MLPLVAEPWLWLCQVTIPVVPALKWNITVHYRNPQGVTRVSKVYEWARFSYNRKRAAAFLQ